MPYILRAIILLIPLLSGCILGNRPQFVRGGSDPKEVTYYLDGAGNMGFGKETVPLGLEDGGYQGHFEHYIWTTYLGPIMDQVSYSHNRREGRELADRIIKQLKKYPGSKVNIIGLSAGSGVAVFALESLPPNVQVENVVLLSSSLSSNYSLARALRRVRGGMYFFWSPNDPVLRGVVPLTGTIDRENTSQVAGVTGAHLPPGASREVRELYVGRVHNVRWYTDEVGGIGPLKLRHAGTTARSFVREMVAPIIVQRSAVPAAIAARPTPPPPTHAAASPTPPLSPPPRAAVSPFAPAPSHTVPGPNAPTPATHPAQPPASRPQPLIIRAP